MNVVSTFEEYLEQNGFSVIKENHWKKGKTEIRRKDDLWLLDYKQTTISSSRNPDHLITLMNKKSHLK